MHFIITQYVLWHYGRGIRELAEIIRGFLWFGYHFFSVPVLFRTLLSPFRRVQVRYDRKLELRTIAENLATNVFFRLVGFVMRSVVLLIAGAVELLVATAGALAIAAWLLWPLVIISLVTAGIILLVFSG